MKSIIITALMLIVFVSAFAFGSNCGTRSCDRNGKRNSSCCAYSCTDNGFENCPEYNNEDK